MNIDVQDRHFNQSAQRTTNLHKGTAPQTGSGLMSHPDFVPVLMDTVAALVVVLDREGRIKGFNKASELATGYYFEEVEGRVFWEFLLRPRDVDDFKLYFQRVCLSGKASANEYLLVTKSGEERCITWSDAVLCDEEREVSVIIKTGLDITERNLRERALQESNRRIQWLADNISGIYFISNPEFTKVHFINKAFEKIWGRPVDILQADPLAWMENIHPDDLAKVQKGLEAQRRGEPISMEYRIIRPDGETRWIYVQALAMGSADGERITAGYGEDITERKLNELSRLQQERENRDALIREVHHRIKNNLQGVIGLLRQQSVDNPELGAAMDQAVSKVRAVAVVYGLQGRTGAGEIMLCEMLPAIIQSVEDLIPARFSLNINLVNPRMVLVVESEAVPLALVVNELLMNAAKHTEHGSGPIDVTLTASSGVATLTIVNPGILPGGFNFNEGSGIGTGLSLVRSLLPKDGTELALASTGKDVKAQLSLRHPIVRI